MPVDTVPATLMVTATETGAPPLRSTGAGGAQVGSGVGPVTEHEMLTNVSSWSWNPLFGVKLMVAGVLASPTKIVKLGVVVDKVTKGGVTLLSKLPV